MEQDPGGIERARPGYWLKIDGEGLSLRRHPRPTLVPCGCAFFWLALSPCLAWALGETGLGPFADFAHELVQKVFGPRGEPDLAVLVFFGGLLVGGLVLNAAFAKAEWLLEARGPLRLRSWGPLKGWREEQVSQVQLLELLRGRDPLPERSADGSEAGKDFLAREGLHPEDELAVENALRRRLGLEPASWVPEPLPSPWRIAGPAYYKTTAAAWVAAVILWVPWEEGMSVHGLIMVLAGSTALGLTLLLVIGWALVALGHAARWADGHLRRHLG